MKDIIKITVLHGQNHKGSTYHITRLLIDKLSNENTQVMEFDFVNQPQCLGCFRCLQKGEDKCPHFESTRPILAAIREADIMIMESPNYCFGMTGQMKSFLDHLAFLWMPHRPEAEMFSKVGVAISTAAGAGAKKVTKDFGSNMFYWGIPEINKLYTNVGASSWESVSDKKKIKIQKKVDRIARKINRQVGKVKPNIKIKAMFMLMRMSQKSNTWSPVDRQHWEDQGWLGNIRPW